MTEYYVGHSIRFNAVSGSWGKILGPNHFGGLYIEYNYGKDVKGEYITARAHVNPWDIVKVDPNVYSEYINCRAWSAEQRTVCQEYLKTRQLVMDAYEV